LATNKHAIIRYQALDKCFRNTGRKYFIEDLIEACNNSIYEFSGADADISRRQVFDDIKFMESQQGWSVELERQKDGRRIYYRYADTGFSINNQLLNEDEELKLQEVLLTLSRFKGMPQFEWIDEMLVRIQSSFTLKIDAEKVIEFEQNMYLKGIEYFGEFFTAIVYKKALSISYRGFKQMKSKTMLFHPYYLKQYNNRWFVFGRVDGNDMITNIAIDRVISIKEARKVFIPNDLVDFEDFFDDVIGVSVPPDKEPSKVLIKVSKEMFPYIDSKPLHGSQKVKKKNQEGAIIEITVLENFELVSLLLSFGDALTVLEPASLIEVIKIKANKIRENYL
jgi:predicted DNA-binding transcriptional regulator YafY